MVSEQSFLVVNILDVGETASVKTCETLTRFKTATLVECTWSAGVSIFRQ